MIVILIINQKQSQKQLNLTYLNHHYIKVLTGNTFSYKNKKYLILNLHPPKKGTWYDLEKFKLSVLLNQKGVAIKIKGKDKYNQILVDVYINGKNVVDILRKEGLTKEGLTLD